MRVDSFRPLIRAVDGARTRDLKLGKLPLCQLSYYRAVLLFFLPYLNHAVVLGVISNLDAFAFFAAVDFVFRQSFVLEVEGILFLRDNVHTASCAVDYHTFNGFNAVGLRIVHHRCVETDGTRILVGCIIARSSCRHYCRHCN